MPKVTINGTDIEVEKGTTILQAAAQAGYDVPHFCYHPALSIPANCRMCLVEVEDNPKLQPGCYSQVTDGMVVHTESERVIKARKAVLEFILVNHPVDCPICDQAGECKLQDYYMDYDAQESRLRTDKVHKVKVYPIGPEVVYDGERCILCTRCIRFCEEITGTGELTMVSRGDSSEIRTFPGQDLDNNYSMCTVDICPVGALTSRDFRFKCRVWLLNSTDSVCTGCATGCNIHLEHFRNEIQRYRPRYNPDVNDYWMCDEGRLSYKEVHDDRMVRPMTNSAELSWHAAGETYADKMSRFIEDNGADKVAFVVSPQASCEDLKLAKRFTEEVLGTDRLYMGGKPDGEEDDLLIHADKNPNRRGVEAVWGGLDSIRGFDQLITDIENGQVRALHMMGAEVPGDESLARQLDDLVDKLDLFVLQSMHHGGDLSEKAQVALPACSHAEKEGTFVNADGIAQPFFKGFAPLGDSLPDWQIFMRLAKAMGEPLTYTYLSEIQDAMFEAAEAEPEPTDEAPISAEAEPILDDEDDTAENEAAEDEAAEDEATEDEAAEDEAAEDEAAEDEAAEDEAAEDEAAEDEAAEDEAAEQVEPEEETEEDEEAAPSS
jgi:NADH-quinone oxidoreductase subunit G